MGKRKFLDLLTFAAQPLPKATGKSAHDDDYNERQTLRRMRQDSEAKRSDKSHPKTGGTARKSPQHG